MALFFIIPFNNEQFVYSAAVHIHYFKLQVSVAENVTGFRDASYKEHGESA